MKLKKLLLLFILTIIPFNLFCQNDYYITEKSASYGVKIENKGEKQNARYCWIKRNDIYYYYSPDSIKAYGFEKGAYYEAKDILVNDSVKRVFLERILDGKLTLYYYRGEDTKTFFIEKDKTYFVELPKVNKKEHKTYKEYLKELTADCPDISDAIYHAVYSKSGLKRLIERYEKCSSNPYPFLKMGLVAGYEIINIDIIDEASDNIKLIDFNKEANPTIGVFIDYPLFYCDFSLYTEPYFVKHSYSCYKIKDNYDVNFYANISSVKAPVLIKYTFPFKRFRPYLNVGGIFAYNFNQKNGYINSTAFGDKIDIIYKDVPLFSKWEMGYSLGAGAEYKLNHRNSLFLNLRYSSLKGLSENNSFNNSIIQVSTGFNF